MRVQVSEIIDRPQAEVFRFVATDHFANHSRRDPSILEMVPTSAAPIHTGTTARMVRPDQGMRVEGTVEITEYEPNRRFAALVSFGPFVLHQQVAIEPESPDSSHVILAIDSQATGVMRVLLPLLRSTFRRTMTESLHRIKAMVE